MTFKTALCSKYVRLLCVGSLLACLLFLVSCNTQAPSGAAGNAALSQASNPSVPTITVTANNSVKAVPDKAQIGVAVTSQATTAEAAQDANAATTNAVTEALTALGIDEASIQTTNTYLNPLYDYTGAYVDSEVAEIAPATDELDIAETSPTPPASTDIANSETSNIYGYEMTTRLSVKDLDIDQVGEVIRTCVAAGANNTDGIQYYSSEYDAKYTEALQAAVADAHVKAEALAQASGVKLGNIYSLVEGYQNMTYAYDTNMAFAEAATDEGSMRVMPGEVEIEASVTVSYEIN